MTKRLIITGALGHIGSYFIRQPWVTRYQEVILIDNLSTQRYASLFNLPKELNYTFLDQSIVNFNWAPFLKKDDTIIHLAAITDAENSFDKKQLVEETNLTALTQLADACHQANARLLFPSTTSVYGSQASIVDENCQELAPQSPYAESKIHSENYLKQLSLKGLCCVILRFGTIHGASVGMRFHTAVNKFIWQARWGKPISVWKTAYNQYRPYLSLTDASLAADFIISKNLFQGDIFNVVTKNHTVQEIVESIKKFIPDLNISFVDSVIMNQLSYHVSAEKIIKAGLQFKGNLNNDIKETIQLLGIRPV